MKEKINPIGLKGAQITERMKELMGVQPINENKKTSVVELTKKGPDGKVYAIVRENHEYYIKVTEKQNNLVAEDFKYIGGLQNKKQEVYPSYAKAIKHLNLKFHSINESLGKSGNINVFENDNLTTEAWAGFAEMSGPMFKSEGNMEGHMKSECCGAQTMEGMCLECGGSAYGMAGGMEEYDKPAMDSFKKQYGDEKGKSIYYATANKQERDPETFEKNEGMGMMDEKEFPDLTGDGKVTYADILKGRGVKLDNEGMGMSEGKGVYYHVLEYGDYGNIGWQGYFNTPEEAKEEVERLSDNFPDLHFEIFTSDSKNEPPITTAEGMHIEDEGLSPEMEAVQGMMEKEYSEKQKRIAALAGDPNKIGADDLAALRAGKMHKKNEGKLSIERAMSMMDEMIDELSEAQSKKKL